ncbi:MAG: hypothetical protein EAZ80_08835 [Runella slithyformis]|nr:MAG: hypothetical protein EAZ80_08835 [Runella slithyformis]
MKTPGRILMGLASLALVFLAISGIGLHLKRAGGLKAVLKKINVLEIKRDGHAQLSRLLLIPILIIAASGVYLSAVRFAPALPNTPTAPTVGSVPLNKILLKDVKKVSYPVVDDEPLVVELLEETLFFDKKSGKLTKTEQLPLSERLRVLNFVLHTGEGTRGWAGVLLLTTLGMVFLSFTGFQMVAQKWRLKKHQVMPTDDAEIIVLVGSETGHTWRFADALEDAFAEKKIKVNTLGMENIPKISGHKTVFFLTSTYGDGDAPENAKGVIKQLKAQFSNAQSVQFSVLGFGSTRYPGYCSFAETLLNQVVVLKNAKECVPYMTVDNQSALHFIDWVRAVNKSKKYDLTIDLKKLKPVRKKGLETFKIIEKKEQGDTFLLRVLHSDKLKIQSGALLGVYPPDENVERYYSVASISATELVLVIKRTGVCSHFLGNLAEGSGFEAFVKPNPTFYCPVDDKPVLMIANGTGIAPFLGMQSSKSVLYWGGRHWTDFELFSNYCNTPNVVFSREKELVYVQDLLLKREVEVVNLLSSGGTVMICGSLTMLSGVMEVLGKITASHQLPSVDELKKQGRILADCY